MICSILQCDMIDRHIRAVNRVSSANNNGFVSFFMAN